MQRSVADLPGGFAQKTVSERVYWYYQPVRVGNHFFREIVL